ncbi:hypothetical protein NVV94_05690 [Pseudomonas sp. LS1212]|uniref:hypothetical protein n=1 Tax=Pseudomonas sp. LS1212 TaxID=2972478 RepID=UPI00215D1C1A|nr:hypothetical protein [Pseudomonas sp. LS1212]UVJ45074.1 hypothetical protein NVV94_05690 [Pseudomonas sp. LS1212]
MSTAWSDARIGIQGSISGTTSFFNVFNDLGDFLTFPTSANRIVAFDPAPLAGLQVIKITSLTSAGVAVAQASPRILKLGLSEN